MSRRDPFVLPAQRLPVADQAVEIVERKGTGHPDTMCDAIMERVAVDLTQAYRRRFGQVLHFNVDKSLLVAGTARPRFRGGRIQRPITFIFGGRATDEFNGERIDVAAIAENAARQWLTNNLRNLDVDRYVRYRNAILPGSTELSAVLIRHPITANDTSAAVACAPLSDAERLVRDVERFMNSNEFKREFPATGEDVKVMGVRRGDILNLTLAVAFVGRYVADEADYFRIKDEVHGALMDYVQLRRGSLRQVHLALNTLDQHGHGAHGVYLTVTGTSAENGDDGQVGRGNAINGLISINRPRTMEAPAGKNPLSHVGKVYTALAQATSDDIAARIPGVREVYVWLVSQIGARLDQPQAAWAEVALEPGADATKTHAAVAEMLEQAIAGVEAFTHRLERGELTLIDVEEDRT